MDLPLNLDGPRAAALLRSIRQGHSPEYAEHEKILVALVKDFEARVAQSLLEDRERLAALQAAWGDGPYTPPTLVQRYTYQVTWSDEDEAFVGTVLEFPSLSWLAHNQPSALSGIQTEVVEALSDMEKQGDKPPQPIGVQK